MPAVTLDYDDDDDWSAGRYIGYLINRTGKSQNGWDAVFADDRIEQTCRALTTMDQNVLNQLSRLRAEYGPKSKNKDYLEAKARVLYLRECVVDRLRLAREARADMHRRVAEAENVEKKRSAVGALAMLTQAVATHRATTEREFEPTTADRLLWARLDVLNFDGTPILELIKRHPVNPEPQPGDRAS
jgi:hypothetical protein